MYAQNTGFPSSHRSLIESVRNERFSRKSELSVTSFAKLSTRYSKRNLRALKILFRLLPIRDSSLRMENSLRFVERNRSDLSACVLWVKGIVRKKSVPLLPEKVCTSLRAVLVRLPNRSSSTFSLTFSQRWRKENRLAMRSGQRNTIEKKLPGQYAF